MNCKKTDFPGGNTGFVCGRLPKPKPCFYCGKPGGLLCDFPVKKLKTKWKTCDLPLCNDHARAGASENVHFCPPHFPQAKAAFDRRQSIAEKNARINGKTAHGQTPEKDKKENE